MTLADGLKDIRARIEQFGDQLDNEEITKDVLIRPMIQALGYDSSDPTQVKAEYSVTLLKGGRGRADYVIFHNGQPAIVMECKALGVPLDQRVQQQVLQYAKALNAPAGLVTDGDRYLCYANTDDVSGIDPWPYHQLDLSDPTERDLEALEPMSKHLFLPKQLQARAKPFLADIERRERLGDFLTDPSLVEEVLRLGAIADPQERRRELAETIESMQEIVSDVVGRIARGELDQPDVVTTNDELDAYLMCKGMLYGVIDPDRIAFRDSKTYANVLIDDNNRKPVCRFHFNGRVRYVGTFDADKQETRHLIEEIDDLLKFARTIRSTARRYAES